jgi:chorismate mutase
MADELEVLRMEIDRLDKELLKILSARFKVVKKVGEFKALNNIAVRQESREAEVKKTRLKFCEENKLDIDCEFIIKLFGLIMSEAVKIERPAEK